MTCGKSFFAVTHCISNAFGRYGHLVGRYPVWFIVVPVVVCVGLGVGFLFRSNEQDIELLYTPINSRSRSDREKVKALFPDRTHDYYNPMSLNDHALGGVVLFRPKNDSNILTRESLQEIKDFVTKVKEITFNNSEGDVVTYDEVCGRLDGKCEVWGRLILTDDFWDAFEKGTLIFPFWDSPWGTVDLSVWLGNVNKTQQERVQGAGAVKVTFTLRQDSDAMKKLSLEWERAFIDYMTKLRNDNFSTLTFAFSSSHSMGDELDRGTKGDIKYFSLTFTIMITYASIVCSGGDCVSTRALLANAGVVAATMGILASFGLFSFIGVQFVNIVGVVPFLILGMTCFYFSFWVVVQVA
ncbi:hypothetical protein C0Q70_16072 [Pomacea canaliculata]|uniref:SSD domain-containing protein n=1 Tax=Pomacea canaliculata TaxID=400727 RepID=A0A2T7NNU0_POMCA|nr:hypothetical protein C0Q70_16072 [Pomacea canaliculata]